MNFCVTDGVSVVATRYVSSRNDAAASLVCALSPFPGPQVLSQTFLQWFSSGTAFSEYAEGGHYKMSKADKRENIILVSPHSSRRETYNGCIFRLQASPLPSRKVYVGFHDAMRAANLLAFSGLDGDKD